MVWPRIRDKEAREAVALLERLKMVIKRNDGTYVQSEPAVTSGHNDSGMIALARRAFNRTMVGTWARFD